jgi:hypothetical protein
MRDAAMMSQAKEAKQPQNGNSRIRTEKGSQGPVRKGKDTVQTGLSFRV